MCTRITASFRVVNPEAIHPHRVSLARVSVESQIFAPFRNLLMGVPWILLRHRFPTGEKGKEELRYSGTAGG